MLPDDPTVRRDDATPAVISARYELGERLGSGGFGTVFRARDTLLQREVAIKLVGSATSEQQRDRFLREARATARLHHPNIVTIHDAGDDPEGLFLVLELVRGRPLSDLLRDGPLAPGRAASILRQVAEALEAAHRLGIVHRDIKPSNILIDDDDRVKVADFGIARVAGEAHLTVMGGIVGTPQYMAPEQLEGGPITPATDLFALGIVAVQLLTGEAPRRRWEPPSTAITSKAPRMWRAIERMLDPDPSRRGTVAELIAALRGHSASKRPWRWAVAVAVVALIVAGAVWMWPRPSPPEAPPPPAPVLTSLNGHDFRKEPSLFTGSTSSNRKISYSGRYAAGEFISAVARAAKWPLVQDVSVRKANGVQLPIELTDAPWDEAVKSVIAAADLNLWKMGEVWILESQERRLERERTFPLLWKGFRLETRDDAKAVAEALQPLLSARGVAAIVPPERDLIVCDTIERVDAMTRVVERLDPGAVRPNPATRSYAGAEISLNLRNAEVLDVIRTIAKSTGAPIVVDPGVKGVVTIDIHNVAWDNAFDAILASQSLRWQFQSGVIHIFPETKRIAGPVITETVSLTRCRPSSFRVFEKALKPGVEIAIADDKSGTLVLRGVEEIQVKSAADIIKKIDGWQSP